MSTTEHTTPIEVNHIPLIRRIAEILEEKGEEYSIRKFSTRLSMSRETFRLIMVGERHVTPSEIEDIAKGLGITVERLKQMDTMKQQQELNAFWKAKKRTRSMLIRAHAIATEWVEVALGVTERGFSLYNLGKSLFLHLRYEEAYRTWRLALEYAKKLHLQYDEKQLLHLVSSNLMICTTIFKEYSNNEELLQMVETIFVDDPEKLGKAQYTRMKMQEDRGNLEQAKRHAYKSLEYFKQTEDNNQIGIALINVAHYEYLLGNYVESEKLLSSAIDVVKPFEDILIIVVKEYAKSLMQLKNYAAVIQIVDECVYLAKEYPDYWGKLQIMYSMATENPSYADAVANDSNISLYVRFLACKSLMEFYTLKRDFESAVRYYEKSRILSNTKSEYLNEGGF